MNTPRIVVRYFGPGPQERWERLVRVFVSTARRQCGDCVLDAREVPRAPLVSPLGQEQSVINTLKLEAWNAEVQVAADGDRLALFDADLMILRPLADVWRIEFDLAYTVKPRGARLPINAGVLFVRVSPAARAFFALWTSENRRMFEEPSYHRVWRAGFGGINQAALGALLVQKRTGEVRLHRLPCVEWNCEDESWAGFDPKVTRIVHVKGELQRALFGRRQPDAVMQPLIRLWKHLEHQPTPPLENGMVRPADLEAPATPALEQREPSEEASEPEPPVATSKRPQRKKRARMEPIP